jgi:hypothetical protein
MKPDVKCEPNVVGYTKAMALGVAIVVLYAAGCKPASNNSLPPPLVEVATVTRGEHAI